MSGLWLQSFNTVDGAGEFDSFLKPLFQQNCVKCHGGEKTKGKVNLNEIETVADFLGDPALIKELIEVIDFADMPPEDEEQLSDDQRTISSSFRKR
jgi:mono/diheme cytochrome c family protein